MIYDDFLAFLLGKPLFFTWIQLLNSPLNNRSYIFFKV